MHNITVVSIEKDTKDEYLSILENYKKMISRYAKIKSIELFNKKISMAQKKDAITAKKSYSDAFEKHLKGGFNIFLHERGKQFDSKEFSEVFEINQDIRFFIGGAFGFEEEFLKKADILVSLSKMTTSHKIAKIMLFEQIYRVLTIVNKHPYHK